MLPRFELAFRRAGVMPMRVFTPNLMILTNDYKL